MAVPARGTASSGLVDSLGWRRLICLLLGLEKQAQGMPDDLITTGFEADAGLKRIEIAVEVVAQGDGDPHSQDAGGLISCGTSSGHGGPPCAVDSEQTGVKWEHSTEEFIQKIFFVNRKCDVSPLSGLGQQSAARNLRSVISRLRQKDEKTIGFEAAAMRQLGGRSEQPCGLGPA